MEVTSSKLELKKDVRIKLFVDVIGLSLDVIGSSLGVIGSSLDVIGSSLDVIGSLCVSMVATVWSAVASSSRPMPLSSHAAAPPHSRPDPPKM